jgi:rsbT co-antagonist protein RsbR
MQPNESPEGQAELAALRAEAAELRERVAFMEWQTQSMSSLAKVMQHAPVVLFSTDRAGTTTMSDGRGLGLLGVAPGARIGRNELAATRGKPEHGYLQRALRGEEVHAVVEQAPGVHFDTWYMPMRDHENQLDGVLGLAVDASERVASEKRLAEKNAVIAEQSETIRELAAPILEVWDEVLCMPVVGGLDADRAGQMMEALLEALVRRQARFAILDLTGIQFMDTTTVDHMLRIFLAARTIGVEGVLSGVRPAVAQTMVTLGVDLGDLVTTRTLKDALAWCLAHRRATRRAIAPRTRDAVDRVRSGENGR